MVSIQYQKGRRPIRGERSGRLESFEPDRIVAGHIIGQGCRRCRTSELGKTR